MAKSYTDILAKIKADFKEAFVDVQLAGEIKGFPVESPSMNYIFGGKFATGRIYEIFGPESSGKTTICTYLASQNQRYNKERPIVLYLDYERTLSKDHAIDIGLDISEEKFILVQPLTGEDGFEICRRILADGIPVGLIVWDSIGATGSASQMTDAFRATYGGTANILASGLRMLNPYLAKYDCSLVFVNQERAQIGGYSPIPGQTTTSGGFARKFFASWRGRVTKIDTYKEKGTGAVTGIRMKIRNVKSKLGVPNREAEIDLDFRTGIDFDILRSISEEICTISKQGFEISIVVGGGNIYRGSSAKENGIEREKADYIGMLATVINALSLFNSASSKLVC